MSNSELCHSLTSAVIWIPKILTEGRNSLRRTLVILLVIFIILLATHRTIRVSAVVWRWFRNPKVLHKAMLIIFILLILFLFVRSLCWDWNVDRRQDDCRRSRNWLRRQMIKDWEELSDSQIQTPREKWSTSSSSRLLLQRGEGSWVTIGCFIRVFQFLGSSLTKQRL